MADSRMRFRTFLTAGFGFALFLVVITTACGLDVESAARWIPFRCPLKLLTTLDCPTCGLGRGFIAAARGHWGEAFRYHPLAIPVLTGGLMALAGSWFFPRSLDSLWERIRSLAHAHPKWVTAGVVSYAVWGLTRGL